MDELQKNDIDCNRGLYIHSQHDKEQAQEQAMDITRIWYNFEHRANPSTIKKSFFFNSTPENSAFFLKICLAPFPLYPHTKKNHPNSKH